MSWDEGKEKIQERLRKIAAGEIEPYVSEAENPNFEAVRRGVNEAMRKWFQANDRYMTVTDQEVKQQVDASLRMVLGRLSGLAPGLIDINVDIEIHRESSGKIAYAFKYSRVKN